MMLCRLTNVKTFLGITGTEKDDQLTLMIKQASALINGYVGYNLSRKEYTEELHNVNFRQELQLRHQPIQEVAEVKINGVEINNWQLIPTLAEIGMLYKNDGWAGPYTTRGMTGDFVAGDYCIEVTYTAGYYLPDDEHYSEDNENSLPFDIQSACLETVAEMFNIRKNKAEGIKSHSEGGISTTFAGVEEIGESGLSKKVVEMLADYKRYGVA